MSSEFETEALRLLRSLVGRDDVELRDGQLEAIRALVEDRRRVLVVQRTGWGKSAVYFIATRMLRDRGLGPTILISPLLALMRNQVEAAARMGIRAETVNSANTQEWERIQARLLADDVDLLLVSEQRLSNHSFRTEWLPELGQRVGMLVVDEVHCISDWGHDFRPHYRRISRFLDLLPAKVPVIGCTATANDRVVHDVERQLGSDLATIRGPMLREGLALHVVGDCPKPDERLAWLVEHVPRFEGTGIVYCLTVRDSENVAEFLRAHGIDCVSYTGRSDAADREAVERSFLANEVKAVVATSALGMGYDKPDVGFVVHYNTPPNPIAYYQQVGRAGRSLRRSYAVLLPGMEDDAIQDHFITTAFPSRDEAGAIVAALDRADGSVRIGQLESLVNIRRTRLESFLVQLEVEGALERTSSGWRRTLAAWRYPAERVDQVTAERRREQAIMREYATTTTCRMAFLQRELDDPTAAPCGVCDNCAGTSLPTAAPDAEVRREGEAFLRHRYLVIEPRLQWPPGLDELHGRIDDDEKAAEGRALCAWGDLLGRLVESGKQESGEFSDELVDALVELVGRWTPQPSPTWITFVPSIRRPQLVADLAGRLGERLGMPVHESIRKARETAPQKLMQNSPQQVHNLWDAFETVGRFPREPVLLIDDIVDSRWTFTITARELRRAGVSVVYPLALADAAGS